MQCRFPVLQCGDFFGNDVFVGIFWIVLISCALCLVFASCHDDAAPASGSDAHCIPARSGICAYSRYIVFHWRLKLPSKGVLQRYLPSFSSFLECEGNVWFHPCLFFSMIPEKRKRIKRRPDFSLFDFWVWKKHISLDKNDYEVTSSMKSTFIEYEI